MMSSNGERRISSKNLKSEPFIGLAPIFPEEIFEDILVWLPVLSLLRFKCVCKSWYSLISSNRFIQAHLRISKDCGNFHSRRVFFIENLEYTEDPTCLKHYSFLPHESGTVDVAVDSSSPVQGSTYINTMGTCNGIICILVNGIYLCNPSTRDIMELPDWYVGGLSIVMYGLGFDEANDDYKVVCVGEKDFGREYPVAKVYSLKANSWKQVVMLEEYVAVTELGQNRGIFLNQKLHWLKEIEYSKYEIVSFDLVKEIWEKIEIPNFYGQHSWFLLFGFGGCLSLLCMQTNLADLWILNEYGNSQSWKKLLRLPHLETKPMLFEQGELELDSGPNDTLVLLDNWTKDLILYDLRNNSFAHQKRMDSIYRECEDDNIFMECLFYIESLVPIRHEVECIQFI